MKSIVKHCPKNPRTRGQSHNHRWLQHQWLVGSCLATAVQKRIMFWKTALTVRNSTVGWKTPLVAAHGVGELGHWERAASYLQTPWHTRQWRKANAQPTHIRSWKKKNFFLICLPPSEWSKVSMTGVKARRHMVTFLCPKRSKHYLATPSVHRVAKKMSFTLLYHTCSSKLPC